MDKKLEGTGFVLASVIVLIFSMGYKVHIANVLPDSFYLSMIGLLLMGFCYFGFREGKQGWALFAIIYGVLFIGFGMSTGNFSIAGLLLMVGGIMGYKK